MKAVVAALGLWFVLACGGVFGTPLEQQEWSIEWRMEELEEIVDAAEDPAVAEEVRAKAEAYQEEYDAVPTGDDELRMEQLGDLHQRMQRTVDDYSYVVAEKERKAKEEAASAELASTAELDAYKKSFVGLWQGGGVTLSISESYGVDYEKKSGASSSSINAPITRFSTESFDVGMFGITTTFVIDEAPHMVEGKWRMTLDGVELRLVE